MKVLERLVNQNAYTWLWSPRTHRQRLYIVVGVTLGYVLLAIFLTRYLGIISVVLSLIPLLTLTLLFGLVPGLIAAMVLPLFNVLLFQWLGVPLWAYIVNGQRWIALPIPLLIAGIIGLLRELIRRQHTLENIYHRTFAAVPDIILLVDAQHRIVRANPALHATLGYTPEEMQGQRLEQLFPREQADEVTTLIQALYTRPQTSPTKPARLLHAIRKDGAFVPVDVTMTAVEMPQGPMVIVSLRDMSMYYHRESLLRHVEKRYRLLFESAPIMYITTQYRNGEPIITDCNWAFATVLGYEREEIIGRPLADFYTPASLKALREGYAKALTGGLYGVERQLRARDGRVVETLLFAVPEADMEGHITGTLAMFVDITRQKQIAAALQRREEELATRERILALALQTQDISVLLQGVLREVITFTRAESGGLYLQEGDTLVLRAQENVPEPIRKAFYQIPVDAPYDWIRHAVLVREPLEEEGRFDATTKAAGIQARVSLPLRAPGAQPNDPPIAVLILASRDYHAFGEEDLHALRAMAAQIALAIARVQAIQQAQKRLCRLQTLRDIDQAIIQNLELDHITRIVVESIPSELAQLVAFSVTNAYPATTMVRLPDGTIRSDATFPGPALQAWFVEHPDPLLVEDIHEDPRTQELARWVSRTDLKAYLGVPLILQDQVVGILHLLAPTASHFSEEDIAFFVTLAGQVAIAMTNARMLAELSDRARAVETVLRAQLPQMDISDESQLERHLLSTWQQALSLEGIEFFRFDARTGRLHLTQAIGDVSSHHMGLSFALGEEKGLVGWVAHVRQSLYLPDCHADERWIPLRSEIRSAYFVPILWQNRLLGVVTFLSERPDAFTAVHRDLIDLFVQQGAGLLENAHLLREARDHIALLTTLGEVIAELESLYTEAEVVQAVGQGARRICHSTHLVVLLRKEETLQPVWHHGLAEDTVPSIVEMLQAFTQELSATGDEPVVVPNVDYLPHSVHRSYLDRLGYEAFMILSLRHHDKLFGHMACFWDAPYQPPPYELEVIRTFAHLAAAALDRTYLYEDLNRAYAALQEALAARDDMLRNVTHELRTPLTMVRGYAELMEMGLVQKPAEIKEHAQVILRNAIHLQHLLDQLLLFQQLRFGQRDLPRTRIDVSSWLNEIITEWRQPMAEAGLTLVLDVADEPLVVEGHSKYLRQVMINLLDNARKFSPEGGTVTVRARREGNEVHISVSDQGIGIPPDKQEKVFERFYQVDASPTRRYGGMGIGLALCKEIVELHGGRIWAESRGPNQGTTVTFTIPAA